jgi:hypothetical protein
LAHPKIAVDLNPVRLELDHELGDTHTMTLELQKGERIIGFEIGN